MDVDTSTIQINVANVQGSCFAPSQPGVGEEQDHGPVLLRIVGEELDLRVAQVFVLPLELPMEIDAASWIRGYPAIHNGSVQNAREDTLGAEDGCRRTRLAVALGEGRDPVLHLRMTDLANSPASPFRLNVQPPGDLDRPE